MSGEGCLSFWGSGLRGECWVGESIRTRLVRLRATALHSTLADAFRRSRGRFVAEGARVRRWGRPTRIRAMLQR
jgi:hypothetical protein